jgi:soluble lytic murein transglycosylase
LFETHRTVFARAVFSVAALSFALAASTALVPFAYIPAASAQSHLGANKPLPAQSDLQAAKSAYEAGEKGRWAAQREAADRVRDPLLSRILIWQRLVSGGSGASFDEIDAFIKAFPEWPSHERLVARAEETMPPGSPDKEVIAWYGKRAPSTTEGATRLAESLLDLGRRDEATKLIRKTWVHANFGDQQEAIFYKTFKQQLTKKDHIARLDRLVWANRDVPAKRMYSKVGTEYRALAEARFALRNGSSGVDGAIKRVPAHLLDDPGLQYDRLRWRRVKNRDEEAFAMLRANPPAVKVQPARWWNERSILARRALMKGYITDAYRIAANHNLKSGAELLDAEWMAGWIALRFLKDDAIAYTHFSNVYREAKQPISKARGAYWAGRASEAVKDSERARYWYRTAFKNPTTYYGQLAATKLPREDTINMPPPPHTDPIVEASFNSHELVRAVRIIDAAGMTGMLRAFIRQLAEIGKTPDWLANVADLAYETGRADISIYAAKRAESEGVSLLQAGFPIIKTQRISEADRPLVHAVIRQESLFNNSAVSRAGARGLMQLMPATAKQMAKKNDITFVHERLTEDADYNVHLGQTYLADLVNDFNGSYILALAAYNAGPSRARQWIREYGDPRDSTVDAIDWIEMIPFAETRNYVQRVLENLQVYRYMMSPTQVALTPDSMLRRR